MKIGDTETGYCALYDKFLTVRLNPADCGQFRSLLSFFDDAKRAKTAFSDTNGSLGYTDAPIQALGVLLRIW